jgi:AcrR family transcriptional regulator
MPRDVNTPPPRRRYDASRRQAAAAQTRRAIIAAARRLFVDRGYAATTMPAIADEAGVALDTIYATVGRKPDLFRLLIEVTISGETEAVAAEDRDYVREIRAEPEPRRKLLRYARAVREIRERMDPLFGVLRDAAGSEPALAEVWSDISEHRARNMRLFVAEVAASGGLRDGVDLEEAADLVWATNSPEFFLLLTRDRGWSPDRFERWLADLWIRLLLP